jgi:hypothetical protein
MFGHRQAGSNAIIKNTKPSYVPNPQESPFLLGKIKLHQPVYHI